MLPRQAPIASFTWGTTVDGLPKILDALSSGPGGRIQVRLEFASVSPTRYADLGKVNRWAGKKNTWLNAVSPAPMQGAVDYSSLAANNNALAYAIMNNTIHEFGLKPNNRRWIEAGKIWP